MNKRIINAIEKQVCRSMHSHRDFVWLSKLLMEQTSEYVSPTTLKRVWGYLTDYNHPSRYTLDLLSRYLGFADYDRFIEGMPMQVDFSAIRSDCYLTQGLTPGDQLVLRWLPNRCVVTECIDEETFRVISSANSKLSEGDTFRCACFVEGETPTLTHLMHDGAGPFCYVIGRQGGVNVEPVLQSDEAKEEKSCVSKLIDDL